MYLMIKRNKTSFTSFEKDLDVFQWWWLSIPTLILAILFHPSLNLKFIADVSWTYAIY